MSKMSRISLVLKYINEYVTYIVVIFVVIVIAILLYGQAELDTKKYKNEIYDLKAEVDSLRETIDYYERRITDENR